MALKINGLTVVDDNRVATFTGLSTTVNPTTLLANSSQPALTVTQTGEGPSLVVYDELNDATPFQITSDGKVSIKGVATGNFDLEVFGSSYIKDNLTVDGNLTVNGDVFTLNTSTLAVEDKNIELGKTTMPSELTADGGGFTLKGTTDKYFNWYASTNRWTTNVGIELAGDLVYMGDLIGSTGTVNIGGGQIYKSTDGKVGIGTIGPTVKFTVVGTDAIKIPSGTTQERPVGEEALLRFNKTTKKYEGHDGSSWVSVGGGATGTGSDAVFIENDTVVTASYVITSGKNAGTFGPVTINNGISVTVPDGSVWTVV